MRPNTPHKTHHQLMCATNESEEKNRNAHGSPVGKSQKSITSRVKTMISNHTGTTNANHTGTMGDGRTAAGRSRFQPMLET